jgi:beta-xylosidase
LVPVKWENGWPILGENGKVPVTLDLPANKSLIPELVNSDEFNRKNNKDKLPLQWQWNHNPDNSLWSISKGFLLLKTGRIDTSFISAKNTLTQRTIGPESTGSTKINVTGMKEGDFAGLCLLQKNYGLVGVKFENGQKYIVMSSVASGRSEEARIPLNNNTVYFKAYCDFKERKDEAQFYYSLDGKNWQSIGAPMKMPYTLPHFMGYRFGLFNYASKNIGGFAKFDWFRIK